MSGHRHTEPLSAERDGPGADECFFALREVHAFLHGELPEEAADTVRDHLLACEACGDYYQIEETITALLRRCAEPAQASRRLRLLIESLHVDVSVA